MARGAMATFAAALAGLCLAVATSHAAAATAAAEPKVITFARQAEFESLDPVKQFDQFSSELVDLTYGKLLTYAYLERPYKLVPDLLTRLPELGADKLTYTFTLRQGVRFHDNKCFPGGNGRELVTDDVLYSLKRYADGNLNHKTWFAMEGAVVGLDAYRAATLKAGPTADTSKLDIAGFRKIDDHRFTIQLTHENPLFLFALTLSATAIVPAEAVATYGEQFGVNPVGTGPFTLANIERKGVLHFVKYARYHGVYPSEGEPGDAPKGLLRDAGKRLPLVDRIDMPLIPEAQPASLMFLKGELDLRILNRGESPKKLLARMPDGSFRLSDEFAARFDLDVTPMLASIYYSINMKDALLGHNKALRQALALLMDARAIIDVVQGGQARPLRSIVPYDVPGNERDTSEPAVAYDLAAARKRLAEAGFAGGKGLPALTISFPSTTVEIRNEFDFIRARFAAAGIPVKAVFTDLPTYVKNTEGGNFQIARNGWVADYVDAEDFYQLHYSKNLAPGPNVGSFADAAYDRAYEASRFMANGPERYRQFRVMNDILRDEVPAIIQGDPLRFGMTQKWVANFKRNLLVPVFPFIDIDMARKRRTL